MAFGITKRDVVENLVGCSVDGLIFIATGGYHSGYCVYKTTENVTKFISNVLVQLTEGSSDKRRDTESNAIGEFEDYKFFRLLERPISEDNEYSPTIFKLEDVEIQQWDDPIWEQEYQEPQSEIWMSELPEDRFLPIDDIATDDKNRDEVDLLFDDRFCRVYVNKKTG